MLSYVSCVEIVMRLWNGKTQSIPFHKYTSMPRGILTMMRSTILRFTSKACEQNFNDIK